MGSSGGGRQGAKGEHVADQLRMHLGVIVLERMWSSTAQDLELQKRIEKKGCEVGWLKGNRGIQRIDLDIAVR